MVFGIFRLFDFSDVCSIVDQELKHSARMSRAEDEARITFIILRLFFRNQSSAGTEPSLDLHQHCVHRLLRHVRICKQQRASCCDDRAITRRTTANLKEYFALRCLQCSRNHHWLWHVYSPLHLNVSNGVPQSILMIVYISLKSKRLALSCKNSCAWHEMVKFDFYDVYRSGRWSTQIP